jgi:predicted O-methyltransferase YrrM
MDEANSNYWSSINYDELYSSLKRKISNFSLHHQIELIRYSSQQAPPIENIDLLHIDGNHGATSSLIDVVKWVPFVRRGGLIVFDDLYWQTTENAVAWLDENCTRLAVHQGNTFWGIWTKP